MISFTHGNLLDSGCEALVNTVNTHGVMGKGIALMFKERYPAVFRAYAKACKEGQVRTGHVQVLPTGELMGPKWVVNFPTKEHWKAPSRKEWIASGLADLCRALEEKKIHSIALPPLGCGNGGLDWREVRPMIESALRDLPVKVVVFEPTARYQNAPKAEGLTALTPARALIAEFIRRYEIIGFECSLLEIHKLAWFLERQILKLELRNPLDLRFEANKYGPFAPRLNHLLNGLDGSYLASEKRIADAAPFDTVAFRHERTEEVRAYLQSDEGKEYLPAVESADALVDGFQSPLGMEVLATVDWLVSKEHCMPETSAIKEALGHWAGGKDAGERKLRLFDDRLIGLALARLNDGLPMAS